MTIKLKGSLDGSVSFTAPADTSPSGSDITLTLPTTAGSANQFVKNSGTAGTLEYSSMVETSTGVGISNNNPQGLLHVGSTVQFTDSGGNVIFANSGSHQRLVIAGGDNHVTDLEFRKASDTSSEGRIRYDSADRMRFFTRDSERIRINADGNVGIGDTGPDTLLDVGGTTTFRRSAGNDQRVEISSTGVGHFITAYSAASAPKGLTIQNADTSQPIVFNAGGSEKMRIISSGNVGIGTASPEGRLHIVNNQGGGTGRIILDANVTSGYNTEIDATDEGLEFTAKSNSRGFVFNTGSTPTARLRMTGDGHIRFNQNSTNTPGFGNTTTGLGLEYLSSGAELFISRSDSSPFLVNRNSDGTVVDLRRSGSQKGNIQVTTSTATFNSASDYRLKENVVALSDGITRLKQLSPSRFNFIEEPDTTVDGFIAHEVQAVVPEAVTGTHNEVDDDGNPVMQGMDYGKVTPLLTAALQEAIAKIETLETKVAALEAGS